LFVSIFAKKTISYLKEVVKRGFLFLFLKKKKTIILGLKIFNFLNLILSLLKKLYLRCLTIVTLKKNKNDNKKVIIPFLLIFLKDKRFFNFLIFILIRSI
jgi:hypothetical protein